MESLGCLSHHSRVTLKRRSQKGSVSVAICKRHFSGKTFPLASATFGDPRHTPFPWALPQALNKYAWMPLFKVS